MRDDDGIAYCNNADFDFALTEAQVREGILARLLCRKTGLTFEVKSENPTWWPETKQCCIEYFCRGKRSGLARTKADYWVQELYDNEGLVCRIFWETPRLKQLARRAYKRGWFRASIGDDGATKAVVLRLYDLLRVVR